MVALSVAAALWSRLSHQVKKLWEEVSRPCSNRKLTVSPQRPYKDKSLKCTPQGSKDSKRLYLNKWRTETPKMEMHGSL